MKLTKKTPVTRQKVPAARLISSIVFVVATFLATSQTLHADDGSRVIVSREDIVVRGLGEEQGRYVVVQRDADTGSFLEVEEGDLQDGDIFRIQNKKNLSRVPILFPSLSTAQH